MAIGGRDLNLVPALVALLDERHISRAATRVGMTQPAMSKVLARLRLAFADQLLVRTGRGYELTPRARQLKRDLDAALPALERALDGEAFDPLRARTRFRVMGADSATTLLGPGLFRALRARSPGSTLELRRWHDDATDDLDRGLTDLLFRALAPPAGLHFETLLSAQYVCVVSRGHPLGGAQRLTLAEYLAYPHVAIDLGGGRQLNVDDRLRALTRRRTIALWVPEFALAVACLPGTDLIATIPAPVVGAWAREETTVTIGAPRELEAIEWIMVWHPRTVADPAQEWLRQLVRDLASPFRAADLDASRTTPATA